MRDHHYDVGPVPGTSHVPQNGSTLRNVCDYTGSCRQVGRQLTFQVDSKPRVCLEIGEPAPRAVGVRHAADVYAPVDHVADDLDTARLAAAPPRRGDVDDAALRQGAADGVVHWLPRFRRAYSWLRPPPSLQPANDSIRSGQPRRIEIVCHVIDGRIYISGVPNPDRTRRWLSNLEANPRFTVHLKGELTADLPAT